jgi:tetratricopeptide (TPR) repeat protein
MSNASQIEQLLQQGIAAAKAGHNEQARQLLMQVVEIDERSEKGWLWLSEVVEATDDRRICLENVLAINPQHAHARAGLEWLDQVASTPVEEQDRCPRCEAAIPSSGSTCPHCGLPLIVVCPSCGEYVDVDQGTCPHCSYTLGDFREGAYYHLALAEAHVANRRMDHAQDALARARMEAPDDPQVLAGSAALYAQLGRTDQAMAAYERAIAGDPDNARLYAGLGALYRGRGQMEQAPDLYQKAGELAGDDPSLLCELARFHLEEGAPAAGAPAAGGPEEALKYLQRALKVEPNNAEAHLLQGDANVLQHELDGAREEYGMAYELAPADSTVGREAQRKLVRLQAVAPRARRRRRGSRRASASRPQGRPGCVTAYALLTGIGGLFGVLGAMSIAMLLTSGRQMLAEAFEMAGPAFGIGLNTFTGAMWIYVGIALVVAATNVAIALGLWYLKNWARIAVIVLNSLGLLANLVQTVVQLSASRELFALAGASGVPLPVLVPIFIGLAIQGFIIFWFAMNRDFFD